MPESLSATTSPTPSSGAVPHEAGTTFYLVRHGQTEYNRKHIVQGRGVDSVLNDTGRQQAEALADRFADVALDALYASPMRRARQTMAALARWHADRDVQHLEDLEEMSWGRLEGEPTTGAVRERYDALKAAWRQGRFEERVEGGESVWEVQTRALRAVRQIMSEQAGGTVLVVTHGRFLRILIASLLEDEYGLENMHRVEHANTGVNHLAWDDRGVCSAHRLNCTAHLGEAA